MSRRAWLGALAAVSAGGAASAQEAMYTEAATMPSPGVFVLRPQVHYYQFGAEPDGSAASTDRLIWSTSLQVGIERALSLTLEVPVAWERIRLPDGSSDSDHGVEDLDAMLKWRFFKDDSGGVDTVRAALLVGARFASGDDRDFSSQSFNPHIGAVVTVVRGRHGFNQELSFQANTGGGGVDNLGGGAGPAEALRSNTAYLFRLFPQQYAADTKGAWYLTAELNTLYETNGDWDVRVSPGIMYEAWDFAFEVMAQLPAVQRLNNRAELDFGVGVGVRITF